MNGAARAGRSGRAAHHGDGWRRAIAALAAVLVTAAALLATGATAAAAQPAAASTLRLRDQTPFVAPTDVLDLTLGITDAPPGAQLRFELYASLTAFGGRARIDENLTGRNLGDVFRRAGPVPVDRLDAPDADTVVARLFIQPAGEIPFGIGFAIADPGVYPLVVTLAGEDGATRATLLTYVIRVPDATATTRNGRPAADAALRVAMISDLSAPPARKPDGSIQMPPQDAQRLTATIDALVGHASVPLSVTPVPESIDALATDTAGRTTVDRLQDNLDGREVVSSPYVRLDADAWVAAGMRDALAEQLTTGTDALTAAMPRAPQPERRTWITGAGIDAATVQTLRTLGIDRLVVPPSALAPVDARAAAPSTTARPVEVADGAGGTVRAMVVDEQASARLGLTGQPALDTQLLLADLSVVAFDHPELARAVAVRLPRGGDGPATVDHVLAAFERGVAEGGRAVLAPTTLDEAFALEPVATGGTRPATQVRTLAPRDPGPGLGNYPAQLRAADVSLAGYRSMVGVTAPQRIPPLQRLLDVSGAATLDAAGRDAYLDSTTGQIDAQTRAVRPPQENEGVTLAANEAELPLVMQNDATDAMAVRVVLTSDKLEFPEGNTLLPTLQPGTNRLLVPVRVRASGSFPLDVRVSSPDGRISMEGSRINVRSTAISGFGLALSIAAGVFLLLWWARHFRSARRARKLVPTDQLRSDDSTPEEGGRWPASESSPTAPAT